MAGRGRPPPAPQTEKRQDLVRLIKGGVAIAEASLLIGINRRTGMR